MHLLPGCGTILGQGVAGAIKGIFGFPIDRCAQIMLSIVIDYHEEKTGIKRVVFCLFGQESYDTFENELTRLVAQGRLK